MGGGAFFYKTIIPLAPLGYEEIDRQRGAQLHYCSRINNQYSTTSFGYEIVNRALASKKGDHMPYAMLVAYAIYYQLTKSSDKTSFVVAYVN